MNILVCIKPVKKEMVNENKDLCEKFCINPYDLFALKEALKIKESANDTKIECVCMGTKDAQEVLTRCVAMGVDEVYLLNDSIFAGSDTIATSYVLSKFMENRLYDYIFCGCKSIDGETGQVVYGLAERLQYSCVTKVKEITKREENALIMVKAEEKNDSILKAYEHTVVVFEDFSIETSISLIAMKRANRRTINILTAQDLETDVSQCGLKGSKTQVVSVTDILEKRECKYIKDDVKEQARILQELVKAYC